MIIKNVKLLKRGKSKRRCRSATAPWMASSTAQTGSYWPRSRYAMISSYIPAVIRPVVQ